MTTPTGTITMADVNVELGLSSTAQISLNDTNVRALAGIMSGAISMNNLRGKTWTKYVAAGASQGTSLGLSVYPWSSSGFGTKYTLPANWTSAFGYGIAANSTSTAIAVGSNSSTLGRVSVYAWSSSGFGTKYTNPATLPTGNTYSTEFSPDNASIVTAHGTSPFTTGYPWNDSTGFGTKYANPGTLPPGTGWSASFKPGSDAVAIGHNSGSVISVYAWTSGSGYGSRFADPSTTGGSLCYGVDFFANSVGTPYIARSVSVSPRVYIWNWSSGFGTVYSNPATLISSGLGKGVNVIPTGVSTNNSVAISTSTSPYVHAYPFSGISGYGTKYADPATLATGNAESVKFSPVGNAVGIVSDASPGILVYNWTTASGFGSKFSDPASLPGIPGNGIAFF